MQEGPNEELHAICFASAKLRGVALNYLTSEKEVFLLVYALNKFEIYPAHVTHTLIVQSDHNPLKYLLKYL